MWRSFFLLFWYLWQAWMSILDLYDFITNMWDIVARYNSSNQGQNEILVNLNIITALLPRLKWSFKPGNDITKGNKPFLATLRLIFGQNSTFYIPKEAEKSQQAVGTICFDIRSSHATWSVMENTNVRGL